MNIFNITKACGFAGAWATPFALGNMDKIQYTGDIGYEHISILEPKVIHLGYLCNLSKYAGKNVKSLLGYRAPCLDFHIPIINDIYPKTANYDVGSGQIGYLDIKEVNNYGCYYYGCDKFQGKIMSDLGGVHESLRFKSITDIHTAVHEPEDPEPEEEGCHLGRTLGGTITYEIDNNGYITYPDEPLKVTENKKQFSAAGEVTDTLNERIENTFSRDNSPWYISGGFHFPYSTKKHYNYINIEDSYLGENNDTFCLYKISLRYTRKYHGLQYDYEFEIEYDEETWEALSNYTSIDNCGNLITVTYIIEDSYYYYDFEYYKIEIVFDFCRQNRDSTMYVKYYKLEEDDEADFIADVSDEEFKLIYESYSDYKSNLSMKGMLKVKLNSINTIQPESMFVNDPPKEGEEGEEEEEEEEEKTKVDFIKTIESMLGEATLTKLNVGQASTCSAGKCILDKGIYKEGIKYAAIDLKILPCRVMINGSLSEKLYLQTNNIYKIGDFYYNLHYWGHSKKYNVSTAEWEDTSDVTSRYVEPCINLFHNDNTEVSDCNLTENSAIKLYYETGYRVSDVRYLSNARFYLKIGSDKYFKDKNINFGQDCQKYEDLMGDYWKCTGSGGYPREFYFDDEDSRVTLEFKDEVEEMKMLMPLDLWEGGDEWTL